MRRAVACVIGMAICAGCSSRPESATGLPDYDSPAAKRTLLAVLDAWKSGKATALARQTPPIRFSDEDFTVGLQLQDYRLAAPDVAIQSHEPVSVELKLKNRQGQTVVRNAKYQITLSPSLAVIRSDD